MYHIYIYIYVQCTLYIYKIYIHLIYTISLHSDHYITVLLKILRSKDITLPMHAT